ncbi:hypothetical protein [Dongia sedimenti]|uniref:Alpha/beta hydrolase n=1 Tax=Dongia sedimenti TaxID=3064282 RepID=A0ABU0YSN3_9PROT|nr:hypothetical protein [Rhodospirillaceae bacterium R-7]
MARLRSIGLLLFMLPAATVQADSVDQSLQALDGKAQLVPFESAPFPYRGMVPGDETHDDAPFLDAGSGSRRGHTTPRGGVYWEDETYSDPRSLLYIPSGFDRRRKGAIVIFLHGNQATLGRDVIARQQVPQQLATSNLNAVLLAPQLATDALDSSAGGFWEPGAFARYLREADARLAELAGEGMTAKDFARMPVILVAYSGGYLPAAWALEVGGANRRVTGVILLDAIYGETEKFSGWIEDHQAGAFFFSAFTASSAEGNGAVQDQLMSQGIDFALDLPPCLEAGDIVFLDTGPKVVHNDFVTQAWAADPLKQLFDRLRGFPRDSAKACMP